MSGDQLSESVLITDSCALIEAAIGEAGGAGADVVHLHMVGKDQEQFIDRIV